MAHGVRHTHRRAAQPSATAIVTHGPTWAQVASSKRPSSKGRAHGQREKAQSHGHSEKPGAAASKGRGAAGGRVMGSLMGAEESESESDVSNEGSDEDSQVTRASTHEYPLVRALVAMSTRWYVYRGE